MTSEPAFQPVKSADRALAVLEALASAPHRRSLSELSRELDIPVSSLHSILRTLQRRMWLETDDTGTRFGIGVQALLVGSTYARTDDVVVRAEAVLDWLSEQTGETVHYGRLEGAHVVYLAKRDSPHQLRIHSAVGRRIPAHATALGKAVLAEYSDEQVRRQLTWPLPALTARTRSDAEGLLGDLAEARRLGYATESEESDIGLGCVAVAVPEQQPARDAISLSVPTARLGPERLAELASLLLTARASLRRGIADPSGTEGFSGGAG
ncbi:IclR family transcriptional regulator [Streptomyces sp. TS71-3]|uniref:IclR family transcriptional regulator n=1 Tax=Streptomyces sp. TS71-3 TaxID=2733862 RepID=UPI001B2ED0A9|nr:IclR family transcriptional regulator [Streptomyces sp. TS71-3]GHJ36719.1 IclR family transcriptional regulator [Streptomyces sp. TS71-3]